jgi:hypothetical protein
MLRITDVPTFSRLARLAASNPEMVAAFEAVAPALEAHTSALRVIETRGRAVVQAPDGDGDILRLGSEVADELLAGRPLREDLGRIALDRLQAIQRANAERQVLEHAEEQIVVARGMLMRSALPRIFRHLDQRLSEILEDAAAAVQALGSVNSPEAAIDADRVNEWRTVGVAAGQYANIREAQNALLSAPEVVSDHQVRAGELRHSPWRLMREVQAVWPTWRQAPLGLRDDQQPTSGENIIGARTLGPRTDVAPWPSAALDPVAALRWMVKNRRKVSPWVPSPQQLAARIQRQRDEERAAEQAQPGGPPRAKTLPLSVSAPNHGNRTAFARQSHAE